MQKYTLGIDNHNFRHDLRRRNISGIIFFLFFRFKCYHCSEKFPIMSLFDAHKCRQNLIKCSCGSRKSYSESQFWKHFGEHLNTSTNFCFLCNQSFHPVSLLDFLFFHNFFLIYHLILFNEATII